jgi:DNA-directed RNA polymerase specialized sigma24 family protein
MNDESEPRRDNDQAMLNISPIRSEIVKATFSRYHRVLYLVAYRVLLNHGDARDAVQSFFLSASNSVPQFDCEGSFRSWLLRGLIDEALAILHKNRSRATSCVEYRAWREDLRWIEAEVVVEGVFS